MHVFEIKVKHKQVTGIAEVHYDFKKDLFQHQSFSCFQSAVVLQYRTIKIHLQNLGH